MVKAVFILLFKFAKICHLAFQLFRNFIFRKVEVQKRALEIAKQILGCGYIKPNHRKSKDNTFVLVVRDRVDLLTKIVPFFEYNRLQTQKSGDFAKFSEVVRMMDRGLHRKISGVNRIIDIAYRMNGDGTRRIRNKRELKTFLKSPETIWKTPIEGKI